VRVNISFSIDKFANFKMPPLPVNAVALPEAFISAIIEGDREKDFTDPIRDKQSTLLASSSADRETAFSCIQQFDIKIQSVKVL
jgi:hypothetical protein